MSLAFFQPPADGSVDRGTLAAGYLAAGKLLHATTVIALVLIVLIAMYAATHPFRNLVMGGVALMALFSQLDARSRYQEYKRARDQLMEFGPNRRIFRSLSGSQCQRDAVMAAAQPLGYARVCRNYFYAAGYRWYHLLPDFVRHHPGFLFSPAFLRATFFAPTYRFRYADRPRKPNTPASPKILPLSTARTMPKMETHG